MFRYGFLILVAFLGGLVGGFASTKFLSGEIVFAQSKESQFTQRQILAKTIIAEEFFLQTQKTKNSLDSEIPIPRALLTTKPDGNPKLIMQDSNGNPRLSIDLSDDNGATLAILNMKGEPRAIMTEKYSQGDKQSGSTLALLDDDSEIRAQIGVQADGNPLMSLRDPSPKNKKAGRSIRLCLKNKDEASISLHGIEGRQRAELAVVSNNTCLSLKDFNGETRAELGNTELAIGKNALRKKSSSEALFLEQRQPSSLVLYNEEGKVIWSAP